MNIRSNFKSFLTLSVFVVLAMLALGSPSVNAQTTATDTTATTDTRGTVDSSITMAVKGSITDPNGSVTVTGDVIVTCRRVIDTTNAATPSLVLLDFDFSQLKGTSGSLKTQRVYTTGENHTDEIRPLQASDTVIVSIPYFDAAKGPLTAKTMLATATLNFDIGTGKLTSGNISVGNNVATSATVGTVATTPQ